MSRCGWRRGGMQCDSDLAQNSWFWVSAVWGRFDSLCIEKTFWHLRPLIPELTAHTRQPHRFHCNQLITFPLHIYHLSPSNPIQLHILALLLIPWLPFSLASCQLLQEQEFNLVVKATFLEYIPAAWIQLWIFSVAPAHHLTSAKQAKHHIDCTVGGEEGWVLANFHLERHLLVALWLTSGYLILRLS